MISSVGKSGMSAALLFFLGFPAISLGRLLQHGVFLRSPNHQGGTEDASKRNLQTIILQKSDRSGVVFDPSIFKNGGSSTKSGGTSTCRAPLTEEDGKGGHIVEETESTTVSFDYEVETDDATDSRDSEFVSVLIPRAVDYTSVGALGDQLCGSEGWECIISFSLGSPSDKLVESNMTGYCKDLQGSGACFPYHGNVKVIYSIEAGAGCTEEAIKTVVLDTLGGQKDGAGDRTGGEMEKGTYIKGVNEYVDVLGGSGNNGGNGGATGDGGNGDPSEVTFVRIVPGGNGEVVAGIVGVPEVITGDDGFSSAAWVILALAILLLLLLCCLGRRYCLQERDARRRLDEMSIGTNWSGSRGDKTYLTADIRNLGLQHSKLDVHKCKSATCEVCSPNLGKVDFAKVTPPQKQGKSALRGKSSMVFQPTGGSVPLKDVPEDDFEEEEQEDSDSDDEGSMQQQQRQRDSSATTRPSMAEGAADDETFGTFDDIDSTRAKLSPLPPGPPLDDDLSDLDEPDRYSPGGRRGDGSKARKTMLL